MRSSAQMQIVSCVGRSTDEFKKVKKYPTRANLNFKTSHYYGILIVVTDVPFDKHV